MAITITDMTLADLLERFGPIPAARIRSNPPPGTATAEDVIAIEAHEDRLYELVDGILVEKTVGFYESFLTNRIAHFLTEFVECHRLGIVTGADGMMRLAPGLVRIPDVSFIAWERLPGHRVPHLALPDLSPDLAVEVISKSNTAREMEQKLQDYFATGVRLVWYVYPITQEVHVYTAPQQQQVVTATQELCGGDVLPGFTLALARLFEDITGS